MWFKLRAALVALLCGTLLLGFSLTVAAAGETPASKVKQTKQINKSPD